MLIRKVCKFELMPNGNQSCLMRQYAGCCRVVFNKALAWQNAQYEAEKTFKFSYTKIANLLPEWKKALPWLKDVPSQSLQQSLKYLESSFKNFFTKRAQFPKFKKKGLSCGTELNADLNAARNILAAGHVVIACGEIAQSGNSVKQEPTEGTRKSSRELVGISFLWGGEDVNFRI